MTIGERIRQRREELGYSQDDLAKKLGYKSRSSINKIELGLQNLTQTKIAVIAKALETTPSYIMGWDDFDSDIVHGTLITAAFGSGKSSLIKNLGVKIPVYGQVAAGIPIDAITDIEDYEEIPEDMANTGEYAALRIHGDSMEPRILDGDVVIVRLQSSVDTGDTAIVMIGGDTATCKKIKKTPEGVTLLSTNPKYDPQFYTNREIEELPVTIWGKVVELRGKM